MELTKRYCDCCSTEIVNKAGRIRIENGIKVQDGLGYTHLERLGDKDDLDFCDVNCFKEWFDNKMDAYKKKVEDQKMLLGCY